MIMKGDINDMPIIGLTAYLNQTIENKCLEAGMIDVGKNYLYIYLVQKPQPIEVIKDLLVFHGILI